MSKLKKALSVVISLLLLLQVGLPVLASAESIDVDASIGAEIKMTMETGSDALAEPDSLVIQMKPASGEPDNPMPEGSAGGVYEKTFENAGSTTLSMKYHALGVYHYEISQLVPNPHPSASAYDKTVYSLTVYVLRENEEIIVRYALRNAAEPEGEKYTGITFENRYGETHITAAKAWDDGDDQDGKREDVTFVLKGTYNTGDGIPHSVKVKDAEKTIAKDAEGEDSKVTWTELPMKYKTWPITYTVSEKGATDGKIDMNGAEYTVTTEGDAKTGFTVTNKHTPEETEAAVQKVWNDANNQDGIRPESLKVTLSDGREVTLNEDFGWYYVVTGLPKYDHGKEITYTWTEGELPEGYELTDTTVVSELTILTNTHEPEKTSVTVKKVWVDGENSNNTRPEKLVMTLSTGDTVELRKENNWQATIEGLDKYENGGQEIEYTWTEEKIPGYVTPPEQVTSDGTTTFTNRLEQVYIEISGTKTWIDGNRTHDNASEITLTLTRTSAKEGSTAETVSATPSWKDNTYTYSNLEKYDAEGYEYTYDVTEAQVKDYDEPQKDGNNFTNPITQVYIEISGTKTWIDGNRTHDNASEITLTLTRTSAKEGSAAETVSATPTWKDNTYTYSNLEKYDAEGYEYTYDVTEAQVKDYDEPQKDGTNFTNPITQVYIEISGTKTWIDGNRTHDNASEITLTLTRTSAKEGCTAEIVTATPTWKDNTYTYSNLEKYDAEGYEYTYDVEETQIQGYEEPVKDGYNFTNTKVPITLAKTVTQIERDGETVEDLTKAKAGDIITYTVTITNAGKSVIPAGIKLTDTMTRTLEDGTEAAPVVTDLETTKDLEAGEYEELSYTYTVQENDGKLTNVVVSKDPDDTPPPPVVVPIVKDLTVAKVWSDNDDLLENRPESITVTLLANGETVQTVTLNEDNKWTATAENLPVLTDDDKPITYTWDEGEVEGYTLTSTAVSGNTTTLTNELDDIVLPAVNVVINIGECYE